MQSLLVQFQPGTLPSSRHIIFEHISAICIVSSSHCHTHSLCPLLLFSISPPTHTLLPRRGASSSLLPRQAHTTIRMLMIDGALVADRRVVGREFTELQLAPETMRDIGFHIPNGRNVRFEGLGFFYNSSRYSKLIFVEEVPLLAQFEVIDCSFTCAGNETELSTAGRVSSGPSEPSIINFRHSENNGQVHINGTAFLGHQVSLCIDGAGGIVLSGQSPLLLLVGSVLRSQSVCLSATKYGSWTSLRPQSPFMTAPFATTTMVPPPSSLPSLPPLRAPLPSLSLRFSLLSLSSLLKDCTLFFADRRAASVMITMDGESRLVVLDSRVTGNTAQSLIYMGDVSTPTLQSRIALFNTTFESNVGSYCVNGVSLDAIVVGSDFLHNDLTVFYVTNSNVFIDDTNFIDTASNKSSVTVSIHDDGLSTAPFYTLVILDSNFEEYAISRRSLVHCPA